MKVLAFNACPKGEQGNTAMMLGPFLEGVKEAGAEVELINTVDINILPCRGCTEDNFFEYKTHCNLDDDMNKIYSKFRDADYWVFATPNAVPQDFNNLLNRMEPLFNADNDAILSFEDLDKPKTEKGKVAFLAVSDSWNADNLEPLADHVRAYSSVFGKDFAGALLRPQSWAINELEKNGQSIDFLNELAKAAGKELIQNGKISQETIENFSKELVPEKEV